MAFEWSDLGKVIGSTAPVLGGLLGGKVGEKVGGIIASLLGCESNPDSIAEALKNNPEQFVLLKKYEMDNIVKLRELELQDAQMYLSDVQSARSRQVDTEKATGKKDVNLYILAYIAVVGFFGIIAMVMLIPLPTGSGELIFFLLGSLTANYNSVYNYFFGSSKSSSDKQEQISKLTTGTK